MRRAAARDRKDGTVDGHEVAGGRAQLAPRPDRHLGTFRDTRPGGRGAPRLPLPGLAVAYIDGVASWGVSPRLICFGALPQALRSTGISDDGMPAGLMRQPRLDAALPLGLRQHRGIDVIWGVGVRTHPVDLDKSARPVLPGRGEGYVAGTRGRRSSATESVRATRFRCTPGAHRHRATWRDLRRCIAPRRSGGRSYATFRSLRQVPLSLPLNAELFVGLEPLPRIETCHIAGTLCAVRPDGSSSWGP